MRRVWILVAAASILASWGTAAQEDPIDTNTAIAFTSPDSLPPAEGSWIEVDGSFDTASVEPAADNPLTVEGLVIDGTTGEYPAGVQGGIAVVVNGRSTGADSAGSFTIVIPGKSTVTIEVLAEGFEAFRTVAAADSGRPAIFVTCPLRPRKSGKIQPPPAPHAAPDTVSGPPWTISGAIVDSRLDIGIESDSFQLSFDGLHVTVSGNGAFTVQTRVGGSHLFKLSLPGYHNVVQEIRLDPADRQPSVVIGTTRREHQLVRRELTVTASAEPVHNTSAVSTTRIERNELSRTAATISDPVRVLHTLPGVASESDASARPVVRGGDLLETRISLDGISLIQPYHFGGLHSILNTRALDQLTFYKSGFPVHCANAQSALILAESRRPADEPLQLDCELNLLQGAAYLGVPLLQGRAGLSLSAQGSFYQYVQRATMRIVGAMANSDDIRMALENMSMPDYFGFAGSVNVKPRKDLSISLSNLHAGDGFRFTSGDSVVDVTYYRFAFDSLGRRYIDTMATVEEYYDRYDPYGFGNYGDPGFYYDSVSAGRPRYDLDTFLLYRSSINVLHGSAQWTPDPRSVITSTLAWQSRRWNLRFPEEFSDAIDSSLFAVKVDKVDLTADWLFSGYDRHLLRAGLLIDYTFSDFDVFLARPIHELVLSGSTNFFDFWGPVSGDTGMTILDPQRRDDEYESGLETLVSRLLVRYQGARNYAGGALYVGDEWSATPRLTLTGGLRMETTLADTSIGFSPRLAVKYNLTPRNELLFAAGHYTQNNYDPPAIALAGKLSPEKVWHGSAGMESQLLPWLSQKIDLFGKYYYDLLAEIIEPAYRLSPDSISTYLISRYGQQFLSGLTPREYEDLLLGVIMDQELYGSRYVNDGRGYAAGGEYFLRFLPADFWHGWISLTYGRSFRQRRPGWRWAPFPLERPVLISLANYYRLPRRYEVSVKYRFQSGAPYTHTVMGGSVQRIGPFNGERYHAYHALDFRFAKGFAGKRGKGHFYFEVWNAFNLPNMLLTDVRTRGLRGTAFNLPSTIIFGGMDYDM